MGSGTHTSGTHIFRDSGLGVGLGNSMAKGSLADP